MIRVAQGEGENGNSQTGEGAMREVWELTPSDAGGNRGIE